MTFYRAIWVTEDLFSSVPKKKEDPVKDEPESDSEDEGGAQKQAAPKKGYDLPSASYFGREA